MKAGFHPNSTFRPLTTHEQMALRYGAAYKGTSAPVVNKNPNRAPDLGDMLENFESAAERTLEQTKKQGVKSLLVTKQTFEARLNAGCRKCPLKLWEENARLGLGKCNHEKCGCTKLKLWLAAEKCPIDFWK